VEWHTASEPANNSANLAIYPPGALSVDALKPLRNDIREHDKSFK